LTSFGLKHPFYLSVTDLKYNEKEKTLQASVKMFTNDLEDALKKIYKQKVDLLNGKDTSQLKTLLQDYVTKHLNVELDLKKVDLQIIGFEKEAEATWIYLESANCKIPSKIAVDNTLLYDYIPTQINIVSFDLNGKKQSSKVTNPEKSLSFDF
jgi:hypothetical protein